MKLPIFIQRLEGLVIFLGALYIFYLRFDNWLGFALIFLAVDLTMAGYLINNKLGAYVYNLGHTYILPSLVYLLARAQDSSALTFAALVWFAHISLDRALGYGLKSTSGFSDTHLGKIGRHE